MKNKTLVEDFSELKELTKRYLEARIRLWKVLLLEKITKAGTYLLTFLTIIVVLASLLLLLMFAFSFWYGNKYGSISEGFLISAALFAFLGIVLILFRKQIFSNNIIKNLGKIMFEKDEEDQQ